MGGKKYKIKANKNFTNFNNQICVIWKKQTFYGSLATYMPTNDNIGFVYF